MSREQHWLVDMFSEHGAHTSLKDMGDYLVILRMVSTEMKQALESNPDLTVNIRIGPAGIKHLQLGFLLRWKGTLNLYCHYEWKPDNTWLCEVTNALADGRLDNVNIMSLVVDGQNLPYLAENLMSLCETSPPKIRQLNFGFRWKGIPEIATTAPVLVSLSRAAKAFRVDLSLEGYESSVPVSDRAREWMSLLSDGGIALSPVSLG